MHSIFKNIQKRSFLPSRPLKDDLPISQADQKIGMRRRLTSSFSVKIQPLSSSSASTSAWAFRRSKSMSSFGEFAGGSVLRKWWDWGWGWILSRKPSSTFAGRDLELNDEETAMLGSWRHVFYKVRSELRRRMVVGSTAGADQGFRYDSFSYAQNFDDGKRSED